MSRYRVTMEFDLDVKDEEQAKAVATDYLRRVAEGNIVESPRGESPEVATHGIAQHGRVAASTVATQLLAWGITGRQSWVDVANIEVNSELKS